MNRLCIFCNPTAVNLSPSPPPPHPAGQRQAGQEEVEEGV
jgi:hypothetical protein